HGAERPGESRRDRRDADLARPAALADGFAAVGDQYLAGDVGAGTAGQEDRHTGDVHRLADAAQRGALLGAAEALRIVQQGLGEVGTDETRGDGIDADALRTPLHG